MHKTKLVIVIILLNIFVVCMGRNANKTNAVIKSYKIFIKNTYHFEDQSNEYATEDANKTNAVVNTNKIFIKNIYHFEVQGKKYETEDVHFLEKNSLFALLDAK